ncbi:TonB-dependent receptor domain-containing protein [Phenylobacterium kunshanense]|nr:TonB-dependent receptor [Phenylobacterium kunshanense]
MLKRTIWLATAATAISATCAMAQPSAAPAAKGQAAPPTVGEVRIEGAPPPVRTSIDRQSYSVANDLQTSAGSISDALRNVPSLEVDVQGNVALRGDTNVTILIDGKPSGMFQGDTRAQALQNLPADQIDRVEVITNPSAAFDPNGSGGIINLVTKKTRKAGANGSVRANVGSQGRQNGGVSASYRDGKLTLSGDASLRHDSIKQTYTREREATDPAGGTIRSLQQGTGRGRVNVQNLRGGLDYDITDDDRVSLELRYTNVDFADRSFEAFDQVSGAGIVTRGYDRLGSASQERPTLAGTLRYRHVFGDDHQLDIDLGRERNRTAFERDSAYVDRIPAGPGFYEAQDQVNLFWKTTAKVEYTRPMGEGHKLKLGYSLDADDNDYDTLGVRGPNEATATPNAQLSNSYRFDQQVHALYGTYERPFGKLTALAGLRLEAVTIDINSVTQAITARNDDVSVYPSLHLNYELTEAQKLTASYSRRIQRPQPTDYNPFRRYQDQQNFSSGNPDLKPQQTDSFELGYQYRKNGAIYQATFYYRDIRDAVNNVTRDIGDGVFLVTQANIGESRSAGAEVVANGKLFPQLSYNISGNVGWTQIDAAGLGFGSRQRDAFTASGRANLSWQVTDRDFLQVNGFLNGKRLTPQGYVQPQGALNLGYRRKVSDQLSFLVTAQDLLGTLEFKRIIDTPAFRDVEHYKARHRGVFVGFTYTFGGGKARDPGFDFGGGGGPPG